MLKALLKKEFTQLGQLFSFSRQGGKKRSTGAVVGMAILLGFSLFSLLVMFYCGVPDRREFGCRHRPTSETPSRDPQIRV